MLSETAQLVRADDGRLICRTRHGFVCANAGVDASNASEPDSLILLPLDPDALGPRAARARCPATPRWSSPTPSAAPGARASARSRSASPGWRRWRTGAGCPDTAGRELHATVIAIADEAAAAADLVRAKDSREPAVRLRGLERHVTAEDGPGVARAGPRDLEDDLFR